MKRRADFGHYVSVLAEVMETTENMGAKLNPFLKRSGKLLTKEKTFHLKIMTRQKQSLKTALNCTRITSKNCRDWKLRLRLSGCTRNLSGRIVVFVKAALI